MNTIEFIKSFDSDNISETIIKHFDETMVLYNLVGHRQDLDICIDDDATLATFILLMDSENDALKLYNHLNNTDFSVYGNIYDISMILNQESIITTIKKTLSI